MCDKFRLEFFLCLSATLSPIAVDERQECLDQYFLVIVDAEMMSGKFPENFYSLSDSTDTSSLSEQAIKSFTQQAFALQSLDGCNLLTVRSQMIILISCQ
jgi:hypothetical protein